MCRAHGLTRKAVLAWLKANASRQPELESKYSEELAAERAAKAAKVSRVHRVFNFSYLA